MELWALWQQELSALLLHQSLRPNANASLQPDHFGPLKKKKLIILAHLFTASPATD